MTACIPPTDADVKSDINVGSSAYIAAIASATVLPIVSPFYKSFPPSIKNKSLSARPFPVVSLFAAN
jgi:hypothetical protein